MTQDHDNTQNYSEDIASIKTTNVVGQITLATPWDVWELVPLGRHNPDKFANVVIKPKDFNCTFLLYKSGKILCVGVESPCRNLEMFRPFITYLEGITGKTLEFMDFQSNNLVTCFYLKKYCNLLNLAVHWSSVALPGHLVVKYRPDKFPAATISVYDPNQPINKTNKANRFLCTINFFISRAVVSGRPQFAKNQKYRLDTVMNLCKPFLQDERIDHSTLRGRWEKLKHHNLVKV